jgi:hypothetical protein
VAFTSTKRLLAAKRGLARKNGTTHEQAAHLANVRKVPEKAFDSKVAHTKNVGELFAVPKRSTGTEVD